MPYTSFAFLFSHLGELSAIRLSHLPLINTATVLVGFERNNCIAHEAHLSFHKLSCECRGVFSKWTYPGQETSPWCHGKFSWSELYKSFLCECNSQSSHPGVFIMKSFEYIRNPIHIELNVRHSAWVTMSHFRIESR